jgi:hypothetical protein
MTTVRPGNHAPRPHDDDAGGRVGSSHLDDAEHLRTRDRVTSLEGQNRDLFRRHRELTATVAALVRKVDTMTEQDKLTAAVTAAIREERRALFNWPRKVAGLVLAVVLAVPAAHELATWLDSLGL